MPPFYGIRESSKGNTVSFSCRFLFGTAVRQSSGETWDFSNPTAVFFPVKLYAEHGRFLAFRRFQHEDIVSFPPAPDNRSLERCKTRGARGKGVRSRFFISGYFSDEDNPPNNKAYAFLPQVPRASSQSDDFSSPVSWRTESSRATRCARVLLFVLGFFSLFNRCIYFFQIHFFRPHKVTPIIINR